MYIVHENFSQNKVCNKNFRCLLIRGNGFFYDVELKLNILFLMMFFTYLKMCVTSKIFYFQIKNLIKTNHVFLIICKKKL